MLEAGGDASLPYITAGRILRAAEGEVPIVIWNAKKPVITIKPLAAGRLQPFVGLAFCWGSIRDVDMVCVGADANEVFRRLMRWA